MTITMNTTTLSIEEMQAFIKGTSQLEIKVGGSIKEKYQWVQDTLIHGRYLLVPRREKSMTNADFFVETTTAETQRRRYAVENNAQNSYMTPSKSASFFMIKYKL